MILTNAPQNEATLSNVGEIGEFRIRNSAKAFSILSSGLYANKIRAIIRELSCNAIDAHVAAGTQDKPYEVHLPTALEPHFSIRDYGTGLSHEQVTQIYTTYFESTKTNSNEFIGALGLGSKSPFSYTDNFTVTAIKDGRRGIYTAFINESGVPSIALMYEEPCLEDNGVEVKFSVNERYDYSKFRDEARYVYKHFKQRPVISGVTEFQFDDPKYDVMDIIPGVHSTGSYTSIAIMGNIAYPIDVPNPDQLGDLKYMLDCGLVMEFAIGELDFQASREGLSYISQTIEAIKRKFEAINAELSVFLAKEANKIPNLWDRALYLNKHRDKSLWQGAVQKYIDDTQFPLLNSGKNARWDSLKAFNLDINDLKTKYNIVIRGFSRSRGAVGCQNIKTHHDTDRTTQKVSTYMDVRVDGDTYFVFNDTKVGALERAKFHWRNRTLTGYSEKVYVLEPADKTKPIKRTAFLKSIYNPPETRLMDASALMSKERADSSLGKNVTIMCLVERNRGYYRDNEMVWSDAGKADTFDAAETYYYLPLSGYQSLGVVDNVKTLQHNLNRSGIFTGTIYGVRKSDMEWVKQQSNWVNLDIFVKAELSKLGTKSVMELVKQSIDFNSFYTYNKVIKLVDPKSPYVTMYNEFAKVKDVDNDNRYGLEYLCRAYEVNTQTNVDPTAEITKYKEQLIEVKKRYPLLGAVTKWSASDEAVAEYINAIDQVKGI
jgi:hypothetical protein